MQGIVIVMLGLPAPTNVVPPAQDPSYFAVRIGWEERGQPFQKITENVTYILAEEVDDQYNRVRDVHYTETTVDGVTTYTKVTNYTRVWEVLYASYGLNSFDNARKLRTRLFDQDIYNLLAQSNLYLIADPSAPIRTPEQKDGQWWERVDFRARFNEEVTENYVTESLLSVEIIVENQAGAELFAVPVEE
jgi:hypothetical protein